MKNVVPLLLVSVLGACASPAAGPAVEVIVFDDASVHFTPGEPDKFPQVTLGHADNGREVSTHLEFPPPATPQRILAHVCRRGGVPGHMVGAIRLEERTSTFEISRDAAGGFESRVRGRDSRDPKLFIKRAR